MQSRNTVWYVLFSYVPFESRVEISNGKLAAMSALLVEIPQTYLPR